MEIETETSAELHMVWLIVEQQLGLDSEGCRKGQKEGKQKKRPTNS